MIQPHLALVRYKQWADRGLYAVAAEAQDRLGAEDAGILLRILDHILAVDRIFQCHLQGLPHPFHAPRSEELPPLGTLAGTAREVDAWYAAYAAGLSAADLAAPVDFVFTGGTPGRMTRGEILLHVCLHGAYHRGAAGLLLQKHGIAPSDDRVTRFPRACGLTERKK